MVKESYVVKFTPKFKNSYYETFILKPYIEGGVWSKARAIKERDFAKNHSGYAGTGTLLKETHNSKIIKIK